MMVNRQTERKQKFSALIEIQNIPAVTPISKMIFENNKEQILSLINSSKNKEELLNMRDPNDDSYSWTPLYWGVKLRRKEIITILLEHGADINQVVNDAYECCGTPLDLATLREDNEIIDLLQKFANEQEIQTCQKFDNIRSKPKNKEKRSFNLDYYSKKNLSKAYDKMHNTKKSKP